jgi:AmmeMemoRadiSam system protein B
MFLILLLYSIAATGCRAESQDIREPAVSGLFYGASPRELNRSINTLLRRAEKKPLEGKLIGLIVPHAGYDFSAGVAAPAYKLLEGMKFDTVILIGPCHRARFTGVSLGRFSAYRTPLGLVPVDLELAGKLMSPHSPLSGYISFKPQAHRQEHCLEVQLPFLQNVLKDFKILPLLIGDRSFETCKRAASALIDISKKRRVLFIASSDLSHFHPYQQAVMIDRQTIEAIRSLDSKKFFAGVTSNRYQLCGASAVTTLLLILESLNASPPMLLKYANSGDVPLIGNTSRVVGYASFALFK